jgi:hypothetical protein
VLINDGSGTPSGSITYYEYILLKFATVYRPQDVYINELFGALSQLDDGVTTVHDVSQIHHTPQHSDAAIKALFESGIRAVHASGAPTFGEWDKQWPGDIARLQRQYFSSDDQLVTLRIFSRGLAKDDWQLAERLGLWVSVDGAGAPDGAQMLQDFKKDVAAGTVPALSILWIMDDHTGGPPTPDAQQADNDLAVGRIIDYISRSNVCSTSAIFMEEDDAQNGADHRVEALCLAGIARIRSAAVAESQVAAARVQQAVIRRTGLRRRVELDVTDRVSEVVDHVGHAKELAPRAREGIGRGVGGAPLRDDVVVGHIGRRKSWRDEVRRRRIARRALAVHRVEQPVPREFRVEVESDDSALQPVVDSEGEDRTDVGIHRRLAVAIEQVQQPAGVVDEPAAVWKVADVTDARPAGRHHILIGRAQPARIGQSHDVLDLDAQAPFDDRCWNRIADLRLNRSGAERESRAHRPMVRERAKRYGAFSVSQSNVDQVRAYIASQEEHHLKVSFQDEFRTLCRKHGVEIDERYVWD